MQVLVNYCLGVAQGTVSTDEFKLVEDSELATFTTGLIQSTKNLCPRPYGLSRFEEFDVKSLDTKAAELDQTNRAKFEEYSVLRSTASYLYDIALL